LVVVERNEPLAIVFERMEMGCDENRFDVDKEY